MSTNTLHVIPLARNSIRLFICNTLVLILILCGISSGANARDYQVEVVIFENMKSGDHQDTGSMYFPRTTSAMGLNSDTASSLGFGIVEDGLTLNDSVEIIDKSSRYRLLKHFAWRQPGLDNRAAKAIHINIGEQLPVYIPERNKEFDTFIPASAQPQSDRTRKINTTTINGTLKLRLGRFLHLDTLLVYTDGENQRSYRLSQSRKMRSRELHYIDNPRFGLLVRILPIEENTDSG